MKHLKIGQYVKVIDNIQEAFKQGHTIHWSSMQGSLVNSIVRISNVTKSSINKNPKGVARELYDCIDDENIITHRYPVECLEPISKPLPFGWRPMCIKPKDEKRNYQVYVGMTEDGHLCFIYYQYNETVGWHKFQRQDSQAPVSPLIAWTSFADWPKAFDLYKENEVNFETSNTTRTKEK